MTVSKITAGLNDAPKDATIAQSGPGLPDVSSQPIEAGRRRGAQDPF
jgi:hypothetical protein